MQLILNSKSQGRKQTMQIWFHNQKGKKSRDGIKNKKKTMTSEREYIKKLRQDRQTLDWDWDDGSSVIELEVDAVMNHIVLESDKYIYICMYYMYH